METKIAAATGFATATSIRRSHAKLGADLHAEIGAALKAAQEQGIADPDVLQAHVNMARAKVLHAHQEAYNAEQAARIKHDDELRKQARGIAGPKASLAQVTAVFMTLVEKEANA